MAQRQSIGYLWILVLRHIVCHTDAASLPPSEQLLQILPDSETFTRALGSSVVLSCLFTDQFLFSSQSLPELVWKDNKGDQVFNNIGRIYIEVDGNSTKKLYITSITAADAGKYTCQTIQNGELRSRSVTLVLYKAITFDRFPTALHPVLHTNAHINCEVSGTPTPNITWKYNGQRITHSDERYKIDDGGLTVHNVGFENEGDYTCRAEVESEGRYDEKTVRLEVYVLPTLVNSSLTVEGIAGKPMSISCKAEGVPAPTYKFYKGNSQVALTSSKSIVVDTVNGSLTFLSAQRTDVGAYKCVASNDAGTVSDSGTVTILVPPTIDKIVNGLANEQGDAYVECQSSGDPAPTITFNLPKNQSDDRITISNPSQSTARLTIRQVTPTDSGNYTCVASSNLGSIEKDARLIVRYSPRFSANHVKYVYTMAGQMINLTCLWQAEPIGTAEWRKSGQVVANDNTYHIFKSNGTSVLQVTVHTHLQAKIYDRYTCRVTNQLGSASLDINLRRATAPDMPDAVLVLETSPTRIKLEVTQSSEDGGMTVTGYRVEYNGLVNGFLLGSELILDGLKPSTNYSLKVSAVNEVGMGIPKLVTVRTDDPTVPSPVQITSSQYSTHAYEYTVTWNTPYTGGVPILTYLIRYRVVEGHQAEGSFTLGKVHGEWISFEEREGASSPLTFYRLADLKSTSFYQAEVLALNEVGWSSPGPIFIFTTSSDPNASTESAEISAISTSSEESPDAIYDHSFTGRGNISCSDGHCSFTSLHAGSETAYTIQPVESRQEVMHNASHATVIVVVVLAVLAIAGLIVFIVYHKKRGIHIKYWPNFCSKKKHQVHSTSTKGGRQVSENSEKKLLEECERKTNDYSDSLEMKKSNISEKLQTIGV